MIAVVAIHAALLFVLLHLSGKIDEIGPQSVLRVFNLSDVPPPPPPPPPPPAQQSSPKAKTEGGSAPNVRGEATPIKAPTPRIVLPTPAPVVASKTPAEGTAATQGSADVAGTGTGSGGSGNGIGNGNGSGAGDDGGVAEPPHLATPVLTGREIPRDLIDNWPRGLPVFLRLRVDPQGYVSECNVLRGTGVGSIDGAMCNIAHDRLRFQPARSRSGQPVAGWFGYAQRPPR